jgi:hypothetical protein
MHIIMYSDEDSFPIERKMMVAAVVIADTVVEFKYFSPANKPPLLRYAYRSRTEMKCKACGFTWDAT